MARPYLFLDFETDGLSTEESVPTQLAMIFYDVKERKEVAQHDFYISPPQGHLLNRDILAKTDVTFEDAMSGMSQQEACSAINDFIRAANGGRMTKFNKPTIVAHNAPFDVSWMTYLFSKSSIDINSLFDNQNGILGYLCTQRMFDSFTSNPKLKYDGSKSLHAMADFFSVPLYNAHGAKADTEATLKCWEAMTSGSHEQSENKSTQNLKKVRKHFQI